MIIWGGLDYVVHQNGQQLLYSMHTSSESPILSSTVYGLSGTFGLLGPFPCYRVYDVEYTEFVGSGSLLEVGVKFLDEDRFGLWKGQLCPSKVMRNWFEAYLNIRNAKRCEALNP